MALTPRHVKKHAKAGQRRRLTAQARLARDRRQAQHATEALQQALEALELPADLVAEIEGRLSTLPSIGQTPRGLGDRAGTN
jgi:hypothetical protein